MFFEIVFIAYIFLFSSCEGSSETFFDSLHSESPFLFDLVPAQPSILAPEFTHSGRMAADNVNVHDDILDSYGDKDVAHVVARLCIKCQLRKAHQAV